MERLIRFATDAVTALALLACCASAAPWGRAWWAAAAVLPVARAWDRHRRRRRPGICRVCRHHVGDALGRCPDCWTAITRTAQLHA